MNYYAGANRLCRDIEFMINIKPGIYWRICWAVLTPILMVTILIYTFVLYKPLNYKGQSYPDWANSKRLKIEIPMEILWDCVFLCLDLGWTVSAIGIAQLPLWAAYAFYKMYQDQNPKSNNPFRPMSNWGPKQRQSLEKYQQFVAAYEEQQRSLPRGNLFIRVKRHIFG